MTPHLFASVQSDIVLSNIASKLSPALLETAKTTYSQIVMSSQHEGIDAIQGYIHFPLLPRSDPLCAFTIKTTHGESLCLGNASVTHNRRAGDFQR